MIKRIAAEITFTVPKLGVKFFPGAASSRIIALFAIALTCTFLAFKVIILVFHIFCALIFQVRRVTFRVSPHGFSHAGW